MLYSEHTASHVEEIPM